MSRAAKTAGKIHKWLALIVAVQILFWVASGLFFAVAPIEWVRSEHRVAEAPVPTVDVGMAAAGLERVAAQALPAPESVEIRSLLGRPVALVRAGEGRPRLYDLASGSLMSPLNGETARRIASRDHAGPEEGRVAGLVTEESTEYRGPLPAWRVDFADGANRSLYVAADTGAVTARRSTLWRTFDFLWSLHIMDYENHENFNSPLLIAASGLALVVVLTGFVMFPSRLGFNRWRKRRRTAR